MNKIINQASIVRYTASVCEIFFPAFWKKTFSAESNVMSDPVGLSAVAGWLALKATTSLLAFPPSLETLKIKTIPESGS